MSDVLELPHASPASLPSRANIKIATFENFLYLDSYPISTKPNDFKVYMPLAHGKAEVWALELSQFWGGHAVGYRGPSPLHVLYHSIIKIELPQNANNIVIYVLPLVDGTLTSQAFDKSGQSSKSDWKVEKLKLTKVQYGGDVRSVSIFHADGSSLAVCRLEAWKE